MKKIREFTSQEAYETWCEDKDLFETPIWIDDGWKFAAELTTECKSYKTACRRFVKAFEGYDLFDQWREYFEDNYGDGITLECSETSAPEHGIYAWHIEELGDGVWYICLVVSGKCRGDGTTAEHRVTIEERAETAELREIVSHLETACSVDQGTDVNPQVEAALRIATNAMEARMDPSKGFQFWGLAEVKLLNGFQIDTNTYGPDFVLDQTYDLNWYQFSRRGAASMIRWLGEHLDRYYRFAVDVLAEEAALRRRKTA